MSALLSQIQLAFMLLTRLPVGNLRQPAPSIGQSAWAFPVVGLVVGAIASLCLLAGLEAHLAAGLAVACMLLITGGLHEDGLADLADGFGGGRDKARKLEIMRDSRIGSYGTLALIMVLGLRVQAMALIPDGVVAMIAIEAASRAGLPMVLHLLPAARADGLGHSAATVGRGTALVSLCLGAAALLMLGGWAAILLGATMTLVLGTMSWLALRQIGGQTGDVLGAMQQISALAAWLVLGQVLGQI